MAITVDTERDRPEVADALERGVVEAVQDAARVGFLTAQNETPVATGALKASGEVQLTDNGAIFGYQAQHAPYVEHGTPPHWPPIGPLKDWARTVFGSVEPAYAVQRSIAAEGTEAQPFAQPGLETAVRELKRDGIAASIDANL